MNKKFSAEVGILMIVALLSSFLLAEISSNVSGDKTSNTVEGAYVTLEWTNVNHSYNNATFTNSIGYYEMNVAEGEINVTASFANISGNKIIWVNNYTGNFSISGIVWKNITLPGFPDDDTKIKGHVYDNETKNPIYANISITFFMFSGSYFVGVNSTQTNGSGYYEINLPPSNVTILASANGYYPNGTQMVMGDNETKTIDIYLEPMPLAPPATAILKGYVMNAANSQPIKNASVDIFGMNVSYFNFTSTNSSGYYEFNVPEGNFSVSGSAKDYFTNSTLCHINESDIEWLNISLIPFPMDAAWIDGYIRDNESNPIQNVEINVYGNIKINMFMTGTFTRNTTTDSTGYYNVSVPAVATQEVFPGSGVYINISQIDVVEASADGYFYNASYDGIIEPGETLHKDIILDIMPPENCIVKGYVYMAGTAQKSKILYVGGSGEGNYTDIQDAINAASNGMTIKVYPGVYDGPIIINKEIRLIGDPIIDGHGDYGMKIEANNTLVENFTVFNCSVGIYAHNDSFTLHNVTIHNCTIFNCTQYGIELYYADESLINASYIHNCSLKGIYLINSNNNSMISSTIKTIKNVTEVEHAIMLEQANDNIIEDNIVFLEDTFRGVSIHFSDRNVVANNTIYGKGDNDYGIGIWYSDNNKITNNSIHEGSYAGIALGGSNNNIIRNNVINVSGEGIHFAVDCSNNTVEKNKIKSGPYGVLIGLNAPDFIGNRILNNTIEAINGFYLERCRNGLFAGNIINTTTYDIYIKNSTNNRFINNTIDSTKISFSYSGNIWIKNASLPAAEPSHWHSIGKSLEIGNMSNAWIFIKIYYDDSDVAGLLEYTLKIWKYNYGWYEDGWNGSRYFDITKNVVGVNITSFSIFAPLAMAPNNLPHVTNPSPANGSVDVSLNPTLSVIVHDADGDTMDVYFYNASDNSLIGVDNGVSSGNKASIIWSDLTQGTTYYWYVIVNDGFGENKSDTWHFTTTIPKPSVVYVDDDYNNSTPGWEYDHFDSMQSAIYAVEEGGTVKVYEGVYEGSIGVNKQVSIISQGNPANTIIKASGQNVVTMNYPCILDGFTIRNAHADYDNVRGIWVRADGCIIRNVTITNITAIQNDSITIYTYGIMINYASNTTLENVTIYGIEGNDSLAYGIYAYESNNNSFKDITIFNVTSVSSAYGMYISHCVNNEISGANVNNIIAPSRYGIYLVDSNNNTLEKIIASTSGYGVLVNDNNNIVIEKCNISNEFYGIMIDNCNYGIIRDNTIYKNNYGITLWRYCYNNTIENNTIFNNQYHGIYFNSDDMFNTIKENIIYNGTYGIYLKSSSGKNVIFSNHIYNNDIDGLRIYSSNNNISFNYIYNNLEYGILILQSENNTVYANYIHDNGQNGIYISEYSSNNTIISNYIYNNSYEGITLYYYSNYNLIIDNRIYNNTGNGIAIYTSNNNVSFNYVYTNSKHGFFISSGNNNTACSNYIYSNAWVGIEIADSSYNNKIFSNHIYNNSMDGVKLYDYANSNLIKENYIYGNAENGVSIKNNCIDNRIISNKIYSNNYGIYLSSSSNNLIYNNYFNNTVNAHDEGTNIWNISKTTGLNILGGEWLGGNFWHDYTGNDTDGDDLGDTLTPYNCSGNIMNGGDWLPLLMPTNHPPATPHTPSPSNGATDVALDVTLSWYCSDPDGNALTYDVYFGTSSTSLTKKASNITATSYAIGNLQYLTTYYWRIVAWDEYDAKTIGPVWSFTTKANSPPEKPTLSGPSSGYTDTLLSFSASSTDPDGDKIKYGFDWNNDDIIDEWTSLYNSGDAASKSHLWNNEGTYYIKVKAEDEYGLQSEWSNVKTIVITQYVPPPQNQPPTVAITFPLNASKVSGIIAIQGKANDTDGAVEKVEIKIDNGAWNVATGTTSWSYSWNTTLVSNGNHTIYAKAYDGTDYSSIVSVAIIVNNIPPNHKPNVNIIFPLNGAVVKGIITIHGTASDEDGDESITKVEIKIGNGGWVIVNGITKWNYSWDTTSIENGDYVIQARAYDGKDYSNIESITVTVKNEGEANNTWIYMLVVIVLIVLIVITAYLIVSRRR